MGYVAQYFMFLIRFATKLFRGFLLRWKVLLGQTVGGAHSLARRGTTLLMPLDLFVPVLIASVCSQMQRWWHARLGL